MSIVPLLMNLARELPEYRTANEFDQLDHLLDDDFGFGIHPMDLFRSSRLGHHGHSLLLHPRRRFAPYDRASMLARRAAARLHGNGHATGDSSSSLMPTVGKDGFQVCMDVSQFKPNELTVKTLDNAIVVEGKHEEREDDHGMIQRHFVRRYTLPKDFDAKDVVSMISSDGVLTVKAPPPANKIKANERIVQIQQTGPAYSSVKAPEQEKIDQSQNGASTNDKMETEK